MPLKHSFTKDSRKFERPLKGSKWFHIQLMEICSSHLKEVQNPNGFILKPNMNDYMVLFW